MSRVVVVTGASGAAGRAVADALTAQGDTVVSAGRGEVDLLDAGATAAWAAATVAEHGRVDGLVHLVGGWQGGSDPATATAMHEQLVVTLQNASRALLESLKASGGRVVIVSSPQAQAPQWANAAYGTAKAAAEAWTIALGGELATVGGSANIVAVNAIVTPEMRAAHPEKAYATFTDTADIAAAVAYLLSDAAAKLNGQRLALHG